ncbi:MAG: NADPH-dependent F420 reductase, partial [Myxococcota bacterium]
GSGRHSGLSARWGSCARHRGTGGNFSGERMKIGLIGGTGDLGQGLALRWALHTDHAILVGSRKAEKARERADAFAATLADTGKKEKPRITGMANDEAAREAEILVLCVEAPYAAATARDLADLLHAGQIVVTPAVSMARKKGYFLYAPPSEGSMAAQIAGILDDAAPLVSAFHTVPAHKLASLDQKIDQDVVCLGDHPEAKKTVMALAAAIPGISPVDGGPLAASCLVESITPLLINLAIVNKRKNIAIKFV